MILEEAIRSNSYIGKNDHERVKVDPNMVKISYMYYRGKHFED